MLGSVIGCGASTTIGVGFLIGGCTITEVTDEFSSFVVGVSSVLLFSLVVVSVILLPKVLAASLVKRLGLLPVVVGALGA